jgi:hypothetical protein
LIGPEVRAFRPSAAGHLDAFNSELNAFVEHVVERQVAHDVRADGQFHYPGSLASGYW